VPPQAAAAAAAASRASSQAFMSPAWSEGRTRAHLPCRTVGLSGSAPGPGGGPAAASESIRAAEFNLKPEFLFQCLAAGGPGRGIIQVVPGPGNLKTSLSCPASPSESAGCHELRFLNCQCH
jgi:hypothetical protein